jgi:hypothetical protein
LNGLSNANDVQGNGNSSHISVIAPTPEILQLISDKKLKLKLSLELSLNIYPDDHLTFDEFCESSTAIILPSVAPAAVLLPTATVAVVTSADAATEEVVAEPVPVVDVTAATENASTAIVIEPNTITIQSPVKSTTAQLATTTKVAPVESKLKSLAKSSRSKISKNLKKHFPDLINLIKKDTPVALISVQLEQLEQ